MSAFGLALAASVVWGLSAFIEKWGLRHADPMAGVVARTLGVLIGCAVVWATVPQVSQKFLEMPGKSRLALMGGGLLASVIAQIFFYRALRMGDVGAVSAVGGSWPVVALVLGVAFLGEPLTVGRAIGVVLVVSGVALLR